MNNLRYDLRCICIVLVIMPLVIGIRSQGSQEARKRSLNNYDTLLALGNSQYRNGDLADAVETFRHLAHLLDSQGENTRMADVLYLQGEADFARQNYFGSLIAAKKALEIQEKSEFYHLLGSSYFSLNQNTDAGKAFKKAIELAPREARFYFNHALVQLRLSEVEAAEENLKTAVDLQPDFAVGLYYLGRLYNTHNQNRLAVEYLEKAEKLDPGLEGIYYQMGLAYKALGQDHTAITILQKQVQISPDDASIRITLGDTYLRTGDWDAAQIHLKKAVELDPKRIKALFLLAKALIELGQLESALGYLTSAVQQEPESEEPHYLMAQIYLRRGENEKALEQIELYKQKKKVGQFLADQKQRIP